MKETKTRKPTTRESFRIQNEGARAWRISPSDVTVGRVAEMGDRLIAEISYRGNRSLGLVSVEM